MAKIKAFFGKIWAWVIANKLLAGIIAGATVVVLVVAIAVPCGVSASKKKKATQETHEHTFAEEWSHDENQHWHIATCGHDEKGSLENHVFSAWAEGDNGKDSRSCSVCGYSEERDHEHMFAETWEHNDTQHWHPATCSHSKEKGSLADHTFGAWAQNPDNLDQDVRSCSVCGFIETQDHEHYFDTSEWHYNGEGHWHVAACSHTDQKDFAYHGGMDDFETIENEPSNHRIKKTVCPDCGLICYRYVELVSYDVEGSFTDEWVVDYVLPTADKEGQIRYFANNSWQNLTTLVIPKLGATILKPNSEYARAYTGEIELTKFLLNLDPEAFEDEDGDNSTLIKCLNAEPSGEWCFEVNEEIYDMCRTVERNRFYWHVEPGESASQKGYIHVEYSNDDEEYIEVNGLGSTLEWDHDWQPQENYADYIDFYTLKPGCASLVNYEPYYEDPYIKQEIDFLVTADRMVVYKYDRDRCAPNFCAFIVQADVDEGNLYLMVEVWYGHLNQGDAIYYRTYDENGEMTGVESSYYISRMQEVNNESNTYNDRYAGQGYFVIKVSGNSHTDAELQNFDTDGGNFGIFLANSTTALNQIYYEYFGL